MDLKDIKRKIESLSEEIKIHNENYYLNDAPTIEDSEYDALFRELKKLEELYPQFISKNSPTQKVGSKTSSKFLEHKHTHRLYSLDNANNHEELEKWYSKIQKDIEQQEIELVTELKIDGLAVALSYKNGKLITGATRGDGIIGELITENLKQVFGIPYELKENIDLEVRGEVYMPISSFEKLNEKQKEFGQKEFANPRNAAAGSLRQTNLNIVKERNLYFYAYTAIFEDLELQNKYSKHSLAMDFLATQGFNINQIRYVDCQIQNCINFCDKWEFERHELDYATDGMVIKINKTSYQLELGYTSRAPKWAIAYKFPPEKVWTEILDIELGIGKTGAITPVAIMKPVNLGGSIVKRASLHNFDEIEKLGVNIGSKVLIKKAAEIIPKVIEAKEKQENYFKPNMNCPSCNTKLVRPEGEINYYCPNSENCPAQIKAKLKFWAAKEGLDIDGLGDSVIEKLYEKNLVKDFSDFYKLKIEDFLTLDLFKEKSANNLYNAIEKSKKPQLNKFITALSIKHVGKETAIILSDNFHTLEALKNASIEDLANIEGIGEKIANSIYKYFKNDKNIEIIKNLQNYGMKIQETDYSNYTNILQNKTFVITGTLSKPRSDFETLIKQNGGKTSSSVSKKTDYLLCGENAGSKFDKATNLGVIILNENEFFKLVNKE